MQVENFFISATTNFFISLAIINKIIMIQLIIRITVIMILMIIVRIISIKIIAIKIKIIAIRIIMILIKISLQEIYDQEKHIAGLQKAIRDKEAPLKVCR